MVYSGVYSQLADKLLNPVGHFNLTHSKLSSNETTQHFAAVVT